MNTQFFKHVVFVTDFFAPHLGGLETVFFHLTKNLVDKGYRVTVLTSQFDPLLPDHEMMHGVEIVRWGSGRFSFMIETFWRGYTYFKQADIIHTTTCLSIYPAWFWARWFDKIALITVHEVYGQLWKKLHGRWVGSLYMFVERVSFLLPFDMYHCVSRYTKNCLRTLYGIDDAKMLTIYNGVDHEFWNTQRLDPIKITTIRQTLGYVDNIVGFYYGHSGKVKGIDYLVAALPKIIEKYPHFRAVINLIPGRRSHVIRQMIDELGIQEYVTLFDGLDQDDLIYYIAASDIVFVPSLSDGFGLAAAETSFLNKKLVVTNIGSLPEVSFGQVRYIHPGSVAEICEAVDDCVSDKNLHYIKLKKFNRKKMVEQMDKLYRHLIASLIK